MTSGANAARFGEVDEVLRLRRRRPQPFEIRQARAFTTVEIDAPEERRSPISPRLALARIERDQPLDGFGNPARRNLRGQPRERARPPSSRRRRP